MAAKKKRMTKDEQIADLKHQVRLLTDIKTSLYKSIDMHELTEVALRETIEVQKATITAQDERLENQDKDLAFLQIRVRESDRMNIMLKMTMLTSTARKYFPS